jgi:serpin B
MVVIAPKKGTFETFEATMTGTKVLDLLSRFAQKSVRLSLPTLKMETSYQLENPLRSLGMVAPFDHADFGGISEEVGLQIDSVVHKTFLAVDERGTEAAAATAVTMNELAMDPTPLEMNVDRPFILTIVDPQTKTLLFLGRVLEPTN